MIRAAVLGQDVSKSRSPAIHEAAYRALGLEGRYEAISVDAKGFRGLVRQLAREGFAYVNVTIPHKLPAARLSQVRSPAVRAAGAANTLVFKRRRDGTTTIQAHNTDGDGVLGALADLGVTPKRGLRVVMVGAGGAAAGALLALAKAGARCTVVARRLAAARSLRARLPVALRARITTAAWTPQALGQALADAELLVSAVPAAAWESDDARAGLSHLPRGAAVLDMAYGAARPALARAVRERTARYQDGLPMLVHQARRAIELALGRVAPVDPLMRAARGGTPARRRA